MADGDEGGRKFRGTFSGGGTKPPPDSDERDHPMMNDPRLRRLLDGLPHPVRRSYAWLTRPRAKWVRLPLGLLLIVCGLLGFLPILGFWMVPVGALLIGVDIPIVRRWTLRAIGRVQRWWDAR